METTTPPARVWPLCPQIQQRYNMVKCGKGAAKVLPRKNFCRQRDCFPWTNPTMLPSHLLQDVTQVTINQTDSPNFNWQLLQLETSLNDYNANLFLDRRIKLVVLISIIIAIWQTGKSLHRIRIITTQPGALQRRSGDNLTLNKLLPATAQLN